MAYILYIPGIHSEYLNLIYQSQVIVRRKEIRLKHKMKEATQAALVLKCFSLTFQKKFGVDFRIRHSTAVQIFSDHIIMNYGKG